MTDHGLSIQRACRLARLSRTAWYRPPVTGMERDRNVVEALSAMVAAKPRWGFWKCYDRRRLDGQTWNHKRVHRVYCAMNLNLPRWTKRRLPNRIRQPLADPVVLNDIWALDFMADSLYDGRKFRTLNVIDEGNREALGIEVATSIPAWRVVRVLEELVEMHGQPRAIRLDNGSELTSSVFTEWCQERQIELLFIQPGKLDQNAYIERFNRTFRHEVLNAYVFESLDQVREIVETWLREYNDERPHDSLGSVPPTQFLPRSATGRESRETLIYPSR